MRGKYATSELCCPQEVACNLYLNVFLEGDRVLGWEGPVGAEVVHRDGVDPLTQQVLGHRVGKNVTLDQLEGCRIRCPSLIGGSKGTGYGILRFDFFHQATITHSSSG